MAVLSCFVVRLRGAKPKKSKATAESGVQTPFRTTLRKRLYSVNLKGRSDGELRSFFIK